MSGTTTQAPDWHLLSWESYIPEKQQHVQTHLRPAAPGEVDAYREAVGILNGFMSRSAYADFVDATDKLHTAIEVAEQAFMKTSGAPRAGLALDELHRAVKVWLSAVRSNDDRTSKWLSKHFGKGHVYEEFHNELRAEYDRNFAYRLAYALRNASDHQDRVLNHVRAQSRALPDGGREDHVELGFDAAKLALNFTELKAPIRDELRAYGGLLSLEAVAGYASQAVERAYLKTLMAAQAEVESALQLVEALHAEAEAAGGAAAQFMTSLPETIPGQVQMVWVEIHTVRPVRGNLQTARALLSLPSHEVRPEDLGM